MKLAYPLLNEPLSFRENSIAVWVIENAAALRRAVGMLRDQIGGENGEFVLSKENEPMELSRAAMLITDPFTLDFQAKKLAAKIAQAACEQGENHTEELQAILSAINQFASKISLSLNMDTTFSALETWDGLVKLLDFQIDTENMTLPEQLLAWMNLQRRFFGKSLFILYNVKACLTPEELQLFYNALGYEKLTVLLLEDRQREAPLPCEKVVILDRDLCVL